MGSKKPIGLLGPMGFKSKWQDRLAAAVQEKADRGQAKQS